MEKLTSVVQHRRCNAGRGRRDAVRYVVDENGLDRTLFKEIKNVHRERISEYGADAHI